MNNGQREPRNGDGDRPFLLCIFRCPSLASPSHLRRATLLGLYAVLATAAVVASGGCRHDRGGDGDRAVTRPWTGPTEPMLDVVQAINRNNEALPTIWARHDFAAWVAEKPGDDPQYVNGTGILLYRRPMGFQLVGNKDLQGEVFQVGSTAENYWLTMRVPQRPSEMFFGEHRHAGKPCVRQVPIQPNLVTEVLGIGTFNTDFSRPPMPVMRFNPDAKQYMFVWVSPVGGAGAGPARFAAQREVWYDMRTKLPTRVILFDPDGRPVLRALLSDHRPVDPSTGDEDADPAAAPVHEARWPRVAHGYSLFFPDTGSKLQFTLTEVRLCNRGVPCRRGIVFPGTTPRDAGVDKVTKLDER
ncbi:MAG TPA: hypothetical protein VF796_16910, partial [Humisphaera sp.]